MNLFNYYLVVELEDGYPIVVELDFRTEKREYDTLALYINNNDTDKLLSSFEKIAKIVARHEEQDFMKYEMKVDYSLDFRCDYIAHICRENICVEKMFYEATVVNNGCDD